MEKIWDEWKKIKACIKFIIKSNLKINICIVSLITAWSFQIRTRKISVFKLFKQWMCLWVHNIEEVKSRYQNVQVWYRSKVHVRKTAWRNNSLAVGRSFSRSSKQRRVKSRIPGPRSAGIGGDSVALAIYNRIN